MARIELPAGDGPEVVRALALRPDLAQAVAAYDQAVWNSRLDWRLHELVRMRIAQINQCTGSPSAEPEIPRSTSW